MVDIHTHILPEVDDGASGVGVALEMLRIAAMGGTTGVVLSPHCNLYGDQPNLLRDIQPKFEAFRAEVEQSGIGIDLYLGGEVFCNGNVLSLARERLLPTINGSRFMLVEFDFYSPSRHIVGVLRQLADLGYVPIVAHPERYECVKQRVEIALDMLNCGALLQINKDSVLGNFGETVRDTAYDLINHRLCHFVASDAHSPHGRNSDLEIAYDMIKDDYGADLAQKIFVTNPSTVLQNGRMVISRPI